jgi:hypothetical protein
MKTRFNFQIKPLATRSPWDEIAAHVRYFPDRVTAIHFARKLARLFDAEIRLTEGSHHNKASGAYFRAVQDAGILNN